MADISKTVAIIFQGDDKASSVAEKLDGSMKKVGDSAGLSAKQIEQAAAAEEKWAASSIKAAKDQEALAEAAKKTGDATESAEKKTDRFVQVLKSLATAAVVKEFLDANSAIEKLELGFTSVTGTSTAAATELTYVRDAADRLGLKLDDAGTAYLRLSAATKGTALEGEGARQIFEAVAKQIALLGGSSAETAGALVQVSQGISKGKFELEDLKSIAERMPGFFDKFAEAIGKTTPELFDLISAGKIGGTEFLKFAQKINDGIAQIDVDTFEAKVSRLSNSWDAFLVSVGKAGAFDAVKAGLDATGYAVEKAGASVSVFADTLKAIYEAAKNGDTSGLWDKISAAINKAGAAGIDFEAKLFGIDLKAAEAAKSAERYVNLFEDAFRSRPSEDTNLFAGDVAAYEKAQAAIKETSAAMKLLGIDAAKVNADFIGAFETIGRSAEATGKDILAAFKNALPKLDEGDLVRALEVLDRTLDDGKISYEQYTKAVDDLKRAQEKLSPETKRAAEETRKLADEAKKAEENAAKMKLELEKLASNERIKNIEFKVELDIARLEEDTKRVQAAFDSINNTINSTGDVISSSLSLLKDFDSLDWGALRIIESQLEKENQLRRDAFELQKELTEAQIRSLNAQTAQLEKGDALIKIDGAGLQPHLEAFMFEILKAIQVRVNRDGLPFLLGT